MPLFRPDPHVKSIESKDQIVFYPARWPFILIFFGFILSALPFIFLSFSEKARHEYLAWFGDLCLSMVFLAPSLGGLYQMFTSKIILTSEHLEYFCRTQSKIIPLNIIQSVLVIGLEIHIKYQNTKILRIPLLFKDSKILVDVLQKASRQTNNAILSGTQ